MALSGVCSRARRPAATLSVKAMRWRDSACSAGSGWSAKALPASRPIRSPWCGSAVDGNHRGQRGPEYLRLADHFDHLRAGPQAVGARLHWLHSIRRQQRGAGKGGDAQWPVNDHVIGATSQLRGFLVSRLARQADGAEQPGQALLVAPLGPVQRRALWGSIEQDDVLPAQGPFAGDIGVARVVMPTPPFCLSMATIMTGSPGQTAPISICPQTGVAQ